MLDNAIKYTGVIAEPCIEVGDSVQDGMNVYFVKDNGVRFDPRYAHKLFGAFHRLHRGVWASGQVDEGTTFFFALPASGSGA